MDEEECVLGQSLCFFKPSLTSWSEKMSNHPNSTPSPRRIPTVCLEKPHWGLSGLPFIKSMIGARSMRDVSFSERDTGGLGTAEVDERGGWEGAEGEKEAREAESAGAHDPE